MRVKNVAQSSLKENSINLVIVGVAGEFGQVIIN